jgi:hypothetical protein
MENNFGTDDTDTTRNAADALHALQADRAQLANRMHTPSWFAPSFGFIAGAYVAAPALPGERVSDVVLVVAILAAVVLSSAFYRVTGIRISRYGAREWVLFAAALVGTLMLFSVALGLVAGGLHWWVALPALAAFALVTWLVRVIASSMRERIRDAR